MPIGLFGPERLQFATGGPAIETQVFVYQRDTTVKAVLYADPDGLFTAANPAWTDHLGELTFFVELGDYDLVANGARIPITVDQPSDAGGITQADLDALRFVFNQYTPSKDWVIPNPLGYPAAALKVQEFSGDWVEFGIAENTALQIILSFDAPTMGTVHGR